MLLALEKIEQLQKAKIQSETNLEKENKFNREFPSGKLTIK